MRLNGGKIGMLSKNNYQERLRKMDDKQERFSIRKFSVGAASVLVGTAVLSMQNVQVAHADTVSDTDKNTTDLTSKTDDQLKKMLMIKLFLKIKIMLLKLLIRLWRVKIAR